MDDIRELKRRMQKALNEDINGNNEMSSEQPTGSVNKNINDLSVRDMLKITRGMNKKKDKSSIPEKVSPAEEKDEQEKFKNFFKDNNVFVDFQPLEIYSHGVFWGGTIDDQIQWVYKVTPEEISSGVDINVLGGFQKNDPENQEIIEKLESYYDTFYKYFRDNISFE